MQNKQTKDITALTDCVFYLRNQCTKGEKCEFRHCEAVLRNPKVCKLWLEGDCNLKTCSFRHPTPKVDPSKTPCYFYSVGQCTKGNMCPFVHEKKKKNQRTFQVSTGKKQAYYTKAQAQRNQQRKGKTLKRPNQQVKQRIVIKKQIKKKPTKQVKQQISQIKQIQRANHSMNNLELIKQRKERFKESRKKRKTSPTLESNVEKKVKANNGDKEVKSTSPPRREIKRPVFNINSTEDDESIDDILNDPLLDDPLLNDPLLNDELDNDDNMDDESFDKELAEIDQLISEGDM